MMETLHAFSYLSCGNSKMSSAQDEFLGHLFKYSYIDLEGNKYGPFEGRKMAEWDVRGHMDDEILIFRIPANGDTSMFQLRELRKSSKTPFLEIDFSAKSPKSKRNEVFELFGSLQKSFSPANRSSNSHDSQHVEFSKSPSNCLQVVECNRKGNLTLETTLKNYHPEVYISPPLMRLPDPEYPTMIPELARAKVFSLYQLIITVPEQLKHFPPYTTESVCCQLCKVDLTGPVMFTHLITIQHLSKISSCMFIEGDVDYWIHRVNNVIIRAPSSALTIPGFEPELSLNDHESVNDFISRTRGFTKKPSLQQVRKTMYVIDAVLDVVSATSYSSSKLNRSKPKLTGKFLSEVVKVLVDDVHRVSFQKRYGMLLKENNKCTFCNIKFNSFYDACSHVGTQGHRDKINNIHYHEGLVALWVRILVRNT